MCQAGLVLAPTAAPTHVEQVPVPSSPVGQEPAPFAGCGGSKNTLGDLFTGGGQCFMGRSVQPFLLSLYNEHFRFGHVLLEPPGNPGSYYQPRNLTPGRAVPALPYKWPGTAMSPSSHAADAQVLPGRLASSVQAITTLAAALFRQVEPTQARLP